MEFHENRARQPFIGFVLLARFVKKWWLQEQTRRALQKMSDEQLKDIGLRRDQINQKVLFFQASLLLCPGKRWRCRGIIHEIYQLMRCDLPFLDTYPDKYYFLLNNERKSCD